MQQYKRSPVEGSKSKSTWEKAHFPEENSQYLIEVWPQLAIAESSQWLLKCCCCFTCCSVAADCCCKARGQRQNARFRDDSFFDHWLQLECRLGEEFDWATPDLDSSSAIFWIHLFHPKIWNSKNPSSEEFTTATFGPWTRSAWLFVKVWCWWSNSSRRIDPHMAFVCRICELEQTRNWSHLRFQRISWKHFHWCPLHAGSWILCASVR